MTDIDGTELTLHAARVSGWLTPDRLAAWDISQPDRVLADLVEEGLLSVARTPRGEMHRLTPAGTERATAWAAQWRARLCADDGGRLRDLLDRFERFDPDLKRLITSWQGGGRDGADAALAHLHKEAGAALAAIAAAGPLWASYPRRLDEAVDRVTAGEANFVASPLVESYHTVWHLMHRDLRLVVTGEA